VELSKLEAQTAISV